MTGHASDDPPEGGDECSADNSATTADSSDDASGSDDTAVTCAECGTLVDTSSWYPVVGCAETAYEIYHFCDRNCRDTWTARNC
jgi:hypothetical protein